MKRNVGCESHESGERGEGQIDLDETHFTEAQLSHANLRDLPKTLRQRLTSHARATISFLHNTQLYKNTNALHTLLQTPLPTVSFHLVDTRIPQPCWESFLRSSLAFAFTFHSSATPSSHSPSFAARNKLPETSSPRVVTPSNLRNRCSTWLLET